MCVCVCVCVCVALNRALHLTEVLVPQGGECGSKLIICIVCACHISAIAVGI